VIHKGYFPTVVEATEYGDYCLKYMFDTLGGFGEPCRKALVEEFAAHVLTIHSAAGGVVSSHHLRQPFIQTHAVGQEFFGKQTLKEMIDVVGKAVRPDGGKDYGTSL
jgi:hypothetical protein